FWVLFLGMGSNQIAAANTGPLELKVSVSDAPVIRGQSFFYRLTATNTNETEGAALGNVVIRWVVPAGLQAFSRGRIIGVDSFPSGSCAWNCRPGDVLIMDLGVLPPGVSREVQIPVKVAENIAEAALPQTLRAEFEGSFSGGGQHVASKTMNIERARSWWVSLDAKTSPLPPNGKQVYTLTYSNTGEQAMVDTDLILRLPRNVAVLDSGGGVQHDGYIVWKIAQLSSGHSDRRQVVVRDTAGVVNRVLEAQAEISLPGGHGTPQVRTNLVSPVGGPRPLQLVATLSDDPVLRGQYFFYRLMATNTAPPDDVALENVTISWVVPEGLQAFNRAGIIGANSFPSGSCGWACRSGEILIMDLGTLPPGASREVQIPVAALGDAAFGRQIPSRFWATYSGNAREWPSAPETLAIQQLSTTQVSMSAQPSPLPPNGELEYTVVFSNTGEQGITGANLVLRLPESVTVLDSGGGVRVDDTIVWAIAALNSGHGDRRRVVIQDTAGMASRVLEAQAEINLPGGRFGPAARTNLTTPVRVQRPLQVAASVSDDPVLRGQGALYRLVAMNTNPSGGATLENVTIRWIVPDGLQSLNRARIIGVDSFPSGSCGWTCRSGENLIMDLGILSPGASREVLIPVSVVNDAAFGRQISSRFWATYSGNARERALATETVVIEQAKGMDVRLKAVPSVLVPGGQVAYELLYSNRGVAAFEGTLELALPAGMEVLEAGGGERVGEALRWGPVRLAEIGQGDRRTVLLRDSMGTAHRQLVAEARLLDNITARTVRSSRVATVGKSSLLAMSATQSESPLRAGLAFRYQLDVTNTNPAAGATLENIIVHWVVPQGLKAFSRNTITGIESFLSGSCGFSCSPGEKLMMNLGTLLPGQTRQVQVPVATRDDLPLGRMLEATFYGYAALPTGEWIQQVTAPVKALVGGYSRPNLLALQVVPEQGGVVTGAGSYEPDAEATVTARPNTGFAFVDWTEDGVRVSSEPSFTLAVPVDRTLTANFMPLQQTGSLTVATHGSSSVPIMASPAMYAGTTDYTAPDIPLGTRITLTAPATKGDASFTSWSNCDQMDDTARTCAVTVTANRTVTALYAVSATSGSLRVVIEPAEIRDIGAQWRRTGTSAWHGSGYTEDNVPEGSHRIEFKDVSGWISPAAQNVAVGVDQTTTATARYTPSNNNPATGSILVNIEPQQARQAGAAWRRTGTLTWNAPFTTELNVPAGTHNIEFKDISGFASPGLSTVTVQTNQTAIALGRYLEIPSGMDDRQWLISFYVAYWNRAADPAGLNYWLSMLSQGLLDVPAVAENFALSEEAKAMYPYFNAPEVATSADVQNFLRGVYRNLLNREPDQGGLDYWVNVLRGGLSTPGLVIGNFIHAAIAGNSTDWLTIWNKIQVAEHFTRRFSDTGRRWTDTDLELARQALHGVTDDPDTVSLGKTRVEQLLP
ncbi:MAG: DUF4214 domain-containing protein, partial [Desulfovibrionales bacterium]